MQTLFPAMRAFGYLIAAIIFFGGLVRGARLLDPSLGVALPAGVAGPGLALALVGAALGVWCFVVFVVRGRGTPFIADPPQALVAAGPYKYLRNPIYVAQFLLLTGLGFALRSVSILLLAAVWVGLLHLFVVYVEEPGLRNRFGAAYEEYRRSVPRWLPCIGGGR